MANPLCANIVATNVGQIAVKGYASTTNMAVARSVDGQWNADVVVTSAGYACAMDVIGRIALATVSGGKAYTQLIARDEQFGIVREAVQIAHISMGTAATQAPGLAAHEVTMKWYAAVATSGATWILESADNGATWAARNIMVGLSDPVAYCDEATQTLFVGGYRDGAYRGARGKFEVGLYELTLGPAIPVYGIAASFALKQQVVVCPSDGGRGGVIRRPGTMEMVAVVAKLQSGWTDLPSPAQKGIVEYSSADSGQSWTLEGFHAIA